MPCTCVVCVCADVRVGGEVGTLARTDATAQAHTHTHMQDVETFTISGKPVSVFGLDNYQGSHLGQDPTVSSVWMSSLVMSKILEERAARGQVQDRKIVEIGAGLGVASLMAWRLGCTNITVTDGDDTVVTLIQINAAAVHMESDEGDTWDADVSSLPLVVHEYRYGQNPDFLGGPFDLVLCSDLIYLKISDEMMGDLVASCKLLVRARGEVLMAHAIRQASQEQLQRFIQWMEEEGFQHSTLPLGSGCPAHVHRCVEMHSFVKP